MSATAVTDQPRRPRFLVVGAGVSGLVAAWELVRGGPGHEVPQVTVLEASDRVGGILWTAPVGDVEVDLGAESFLARRPEGLQLAAELGLGDEVVHPVTAAATVVRGAAVHRLPAGTMMGVPGALAPLHGLLTDDEVARVAQEPARSWDPVDGDVSVGAFVEQRVGRAVVDHLVEPLLGGVYAGHADELSLRCTVPALAAAARQGTSVVAAAAAATSRSAGSGEGPPPPVFAGLPGGVGRLPVVLRDALVARGVQVRTGFAVESVVSTDGGWTVVGRHEVLTADALVLAVPAGPAARLLAGTGSDGARRAAEQVGRIEVAGVGVVALVLPREQTAGLVGSGLLVPPVEGGHVKAMTYSSAKWGWVDELDPAHAVVRLSLGRHRAEQVLDRDDEDLADLALQDAAARLGRTLTPVATRVVRWPHALPQYAVGHLDRVAHVRAAVQRSDSPLAVCGSWLDGVGVPACIAAAREAARSLQARLAVSGVGATGTPARGTMAP